MYESWRNNAKAAFKAVEQHLDILRRLQGINGWGAVVVSESIQKYCDRTALATLLQYNKEDVVNLKALRERLDATGVRG
jgi:uncharacterized protein YprB with RNaseH-like and TPR domain